MKRNIFALVILFLPSAWAGEENWQSTVVTLPRSQAQLEGYVTESNQFRVDKIRPAFSTVQLSGGLLGSSLSSAQTTCRALGSALSVTKTHSKRVYNFSSFGYPFSESELESALYKIENKPKLTSLSVSLVRSEESLVTPMSAQEFEENFAAALNENRDQIIKTGSFSVSLKQVDDVACDLILGLSKIEVHYTVQIELAKKVRISIISAIDFGQVYEELKRKPLNSSKVSDRLLISGALISQAMRERLNKSLEFYGLENFLEISKALVSQETGVLKSISENQYDHVAKSLDKVSTRSAHYILKVNFNSQMADK